MSVLKIKLSTSPCDYIMHFVKETVGKLFEKSWQSAFKMYILWGFGMIKMKRNWPNLAATYLHCTRKSKLTTIFRHKLLRIWDYSYWNDIHCYQHYGTGHTCAGKFGLNIRTFRRTILFRRLFPILWFLPFYRQTKNEKAHDFLSSQELIFFFKLCK